MKLEDIIMVVENREGKETNFLLDLTDYMETALKLWGDYAEDMAAAVSDLYETKGEKKNWGTLYYGEGKTIRAAFCESEPQLRGFLCGNFNDGESVFDESRCSRDCLEALRAYNMGTDGRPLPDGFHYEPVEHRFRSGEVLRNLNGKDYRVLSVLSPKNLLLIGQPDNQLVVAKDTRLYARYPKGERPDSPNTLRGVEWGHGVYLGDDITKLDFDILRQEHGEPDREGDIPALRDEASRKFWMHKKVERKEGLAARVRAAAKESMEEIYGTSDPEVFRVMLDKGVYDSVHRENDRRKETDRFTH